MRRSLALLAAAAGAVCILSPGRTANGRTVDLIVDSDVPAGAILKTTTALTYDGGADVDATCEHAVTVAGGPPPLLLNIATSASPVVPGQDVHYTLTVTNRETRAIDNVIVMMRVPSGLQFNYVNNSEPNNSGCAACIEGGEASWTLGSMPSKSSMGTGMQLRSAIGMEPPASVIGGTITSAPGCRSSARSAT